MQTSGSLFVFFQNSNLLCMCGKDYIHWKLKNLEYSLAFFLIFFHTLVAFFLSLLFEVCSMKLTVLYVLLESWPTEFKILFSETNNRSILSEEWVLNLSSSFIVLLPVCATTGKRFFLRNRLVPLCWKRFYCSDC